MKFQLPLFRVCLIFYTYDSGEISKSIGNNTMKKMLLATALALLITGCAQQTFTVQNKPAVVAPKRKPSPIISSFLELGRRNCRCSHKIVAAQKMLKGKNRNSSKHSYRIARFYYFRHLYSAGSTVYCSQ